MLTSLTARRAIATVLAVAAISAGADCANAGMIKSFPSSARPSTLHSTAFSTPGSISAWTKQHTVAPSQFHSPVGSFTNSFAGKQQTKGYATFNGPAAGPPGAQFGRLPTTNKSFVDPTRNSVNAHQTKNSVQATNTQQSTNAVQGRNCSLNAIRAGLCQGR